MALNKQIWLSDIQENFYPNNSFAAKSVDDSAFVSAKTVHVPNAGEPSGVQINRTSRPADVEYRSDNDLEYNIDELTTNPIYIPNADMLELSYDKRQSVIYNDRNALQAEASQNLLYKWANEKSVFLTSGEARAAHTSTTATGNRKKITKADVIAISTQFNQDNVPLDNRYILLDAIMYNDLLSDLTDKELSAFLASANAQDGVMGKLYGFEVLLRSKVLKMTAAKKLLKWSETATATELAAGIAWQERCVSRALGEIKMFNKTDDPTYYGDIYSFLVRTGGSPRRYDQKGVSLIIESSAS